MHAIHESQTIKLNRGQFPRLAAENGFELTNAKGRLWVTIDGERGDIFLGAQASLARRDCQAVLVEALEDAELRWVPGVEPKAAEARCNCDGNRATWSTALSGFLSAVLAGAQGPRLASC